MASHASDFAFLAETARRAIADLRRSVRRVSRKQTDRGSQFLAAIETVLDAVEAGIAQRTGDFAAAHDDAERDSLVRAMQQINHDLRNIHSTTPWIETAQQSSLPLGLLCFLDEMAAALVKGAPDVVAAASPTYMYSTIHKPFHAEITALHAQYPAGAMPIVVQYPAQEVESLFLHLIVAHELGHSAIEEHQLLDAVASRHPDLPALNLKLGQAAAEIQTTENVSAAEAAVALRACIGSWLAEIICDALALGFLGPSFLFTAAAFGTPFGATTPSSSHPPHAIRTSILLGYLADWKWRSLLETRVPVILDWLDETAGRTIDVGGKPYYATLVDALVDLAPTVASVVSEHLDAGLFSREDYDDQAEEIASFLDARILPSQLLDGTPVDRRAALLEGWLTAFDRSGDEPQALPAVLADRESQAFLVNAFEMSTVLERWQDLP